MIISRPANSRAHIVRSFIDTRRTFSFPPYYDSNYIHFSDLQTINDDRVQHTWQVPWHEHKNMEIFGYVVEGNSHHVDSLGHDVEVPTGAVQRMTAGKGIWHTEGNSTNTPNRYLQLWIRPNVLDVEPRHDYHVFTRQDKLNNFCEITEKLPIVADAKFYAGIFTSEFEYELDTLRKYYLYVVNGKCVLNDMNLVEGDGLSFIQENHINIQTDSESEIILFDLKP
jgi:redox-sensitive bicupin YhaK (pirin superfamily)